VKEYECQYCGKFIPEDEGITCVDGSWVCDDNSCRTLDDENEAYIKEV
jgi:ribosomal protein S26